jgi:hypothetical protein
VCFTAILSATMEFLSIPGLLGVLRLLIVFLHDVIFLAPINMSYLYWPTLRNFHVDWIKLFVKPNFTEFCKVSVREDRRELFANLMIIPFSFHSGNFHFGPRK